MFRKLNLLENDNDKDWRQEGIKNDNDRDWRQEGIKNVYTIPIVMF